MCHKCFLTDVVTIELLKLSAQSPQRTWKSRLRRPLDAPAGVEPLRRTPSTLAPGRLVLRQAAATAPYSPSSSPWSSFLALHRVPVLVARLLTSPAPTRSLLPRGSGDVLRLFHSMDGADCVGIGARGRTGRGQAARLHCRIQRSTLHGRHGWWRAPWR